MAANAAHLKYRPEIDGLRAVAVLLVIIAHAGYAMRGGGILTGGFIGVDIFFVISGYLISLLVLTAGAGFSYREFFARRIRRLFPPLLVVVLFTLLVGYVLLTARQEVLLARHAIASLLYVQNFNLWSEVGYFDPSALQKPLLHIWSLSVEEQFYLIHPFLLLLVVRRLGERRLVPVLAVIAIVSLAIAQLGTQFFPHAGFYLLPSRAWELMAGALLAVIERRAGQPAKPSGLLAGLGLAMIVASALFFDKKTPHPSLFTLAPVAGTMLVIHFARGADFISRAFASRPAVGVGRISYGLYLWHWPLLAFAFAYYGQTAPAPVIAGLMLLAVLLSWLSYRFLEMPIRSRGGKRSVRALLGSSAALVLLSLGLVAGAAPASLAARPAQTAAPTKDAPPASLATTQVADAAPAPSGPATAPSGTMAQAATPESFEALKARFSAQMEGPLWDMQKNDICLKRYGMDEARDWAWFFCMQSKDGPPQVLVLGTSFANGYYPALRAASALKNKTILSWGTCDIAAAVYVIQWPDARHPCKGDRAALQARKIDDMLRSETSIQLIVAIADHLSDPQYTQAFIARLKEFRTLTQGRAKLLVMLPHYIPSEAFDNAACLPRPLIPPSPQCHVPAQTKAAFDERFAPLKAALQRELPDVPLVDPNPVFCNDNGCDLVLLDGMPVYRDPGFHLTRRVMELEVPRIDAALRGYGLR